MKKVTFFCTLMLISMMSLAFVSCSQSLDDALKSLQKELPEDCGQGFKFTKCAINGNNVEFTVSNDESTLPMNNALFTSAAKMVGKEMTKEFKEILQLCKEEKKGFNLIFVGEKSGDSVKVIELSAEDIQKDPDL